MRVCGVPINVSLYTRHKSLHPTSSSRFRLGSGAQRTRSYLAQVKAGTNQLTQVARDPTLQNPRMRLPTTPMWKLHRRTQGGMGYGVQVSAYVQTTMKYACYTPNTICIYSPYANHVHDGSSVMSHALNACVVIYSSTCVTMQALR